MSRTVCLGRLVCSDAPGLAQAVPKRWSSSWMGAGAPHNQVWTQRCWTLGW